jgi:hypothetical protein
MSFSASAPDEAGLASRQPWSSMLPGTRARRDNGCTEASAGTLPNEVPEGSHGSASQDCPTRCETRSSSVGGDATGAITCYSRRVIGFDRPASRTGDILAAHASVALERTFGRLTFATRTETWQRALPSRDLIGQAKGALMQRHHVDADQALLEIGHLSQRLNKKVKTSPNRSSRIGDCPTRDVGPRRPRLPDLPDRCLSHDAAARLSAPPPVPRRPRPTRVPRRHARHLTDAVRSSPLGTAPKIGR